MIGGFEDAEGKAITGFQGLKNNLLAYFELEDDIPMPMLIRETARKFQWTVVHATVWRRKQ